MRSYIPVLLFALTTCLPAQQTAPPSSSQPNVFFGDKPNKKDKGTTRPVHGVVKDAAGNYIAQAIVELKDVKTGRKVETVTKPDGTYRFDDLKIADNYELQARHGKLTSALKTLSIYDSRKDLTINLELEPAGGAASTSASEWKQLYNGKDETGWKHVGPGRFVVEDGLLKTESGMGLLWYTGEKFGNTTIRVVFKTTTPTDNSGVYIRLPEAPPDPWYAVHNGYETQIDAAGDDWHCTGAIYSLSKVSKRTQKPMGEWNTMDIVLKGQETTVFLNGEQVNDFFGNQPVPERKMWFEPVRGPRPDIGYIGLQNHDGKSTVYFKEISVKQ